MPTSVWRLARHSLIPSTGSLLTTASPTPYGERGMVVEALGPLTESPDPCCADGPFTVLHWIAELLIDLEEDRVLRAVLVGMLQERDRLSLWPTSVARCVLAGITSQSPGRRNTPPCHSHEPAHTLDTSQRLPQAWRIQSCACPSGSLRETRCRSSYT